MSNFQFLLAKSYDGNLPEVPTYAKLVPHLKAVGKAGETIVESVGELILDHLALPTAPWLKRLEAAVKVGCLCHDIGKANEAFQEMVRGRLPATRQPARHELLSALLLEEQDSPLRQWATSLLRAVIDDHELDALLNSVIGAVAGHHLKLDQEWTKAALALRGAGCGSELKMLLSHSDMQCLFGAQLFQREIKFSLVDQSSDFIGLRRLGFKMNSKRWEDMLSTDKEWWRFSAAVKALVAAADVAGSALLPEKQNVRGWIRHRLSQRVASDSIARVVNARLGNNNPRPFQSAIGESRDRVTLVEAGCGTGKTVAAYMWARHHAEDKKLFFCYPTTGTATEGFLGYVHETDVEAELIHSRAVVDLEGISQVKGDQDNDDHFLRVESLRLWSPEVIVCTIDTVLALVRNNRRGLYNSPAILAGAFIFDELHAYDDSMLVGVIALIKALPGASFLLMSASLPPSRKEFLLRNIDSVCEIPGPSGLEEIRRYLFKRIASCDDAFRITTDAITDEKRVLWICNTVERAQKVFDDLWDQHGEKVKTYHSRFKYADRVLRHREIVDAFGSSESGGLVAVTTQVAEMSLDLDAHVLITDVAPVSALIQRLGRLNRRVTEKNHGTPRWAYFVTPERSAPYNEKALEDAQGWIDKLMDTGTALSQSDLIRHFHTPASELRLNLTTAWLDSGWCAWPESIRDVSCSVSVILPEDERVCRENRAEITRRSIPMNYNSVMETWTEFRGILVAPIEAIEYEATRGAAMKRRTCFV